MGIRIARKPHWIGLGYLAASLICAAPAVVHAGSPSINLQCVAKTLLKGDAPAAGTSQPTCGQQWYQHAEGPIVITLQDGTVLAAAGQEDDIHGSYTNTAEVYHPNEGIFLPVGSMPVGNNYPGDPQYVLLGNGQVLIASPNTSGADTSEIYVPDLLSFLTVGSFSTYPVFAFNLTAFGSTDALLAGGIAYPSNNATDGGGSFLTEAQVYNAGTKKYSITGALNQARAYQGAVELADGKVLVVGGYTGYDNAGCIDYPTASAEIYDPATGKFTLAGNMTTGRASPYVVLLHDGRVLIVSGVTSVGTYCDDPPSISAEIYDPVSGSFSSTGSLVRALPLLATTDQVNRPLLLSNGNVLIGDEIYSPATGSFSLAPGLAASAVELDEFRGSSPALLQSGQVLEVGGYSTSAYLYQPPN